MKYPTQVYKGKEYKLYRGERYFSRGGKRLHRVVWEDVNGPIPIGSHVHHKDGDTSNNDISNLDVKPARQHLSEHMTNERRELARIHIETIRPLAKEWHRSEEGRAWHRQHGVKTYQQRVPVTRECSHCHTPFQTRQYSRHARFCSSNCKMKARRRRLKGLAEDALIA